MSRWLMVARYRLPTVLIFLVMATRPVIADTTSVRVGSELNFRPYAFTNPDGQATGFSVDLIQAVSQAMGLRIHLTTGPWDRLWNELRAGRLDVLPIVAKTPSRLPLVDFSLPHTETFDAFFVRRSQPAIPDLAAAAGKAIVVMRSDAAHHELIERNFKGKLVLVESIPQGLQLVASGQYDAFLCSKLIGTLELQQHGLKGLTAGPPIPDYKRVFAFAVPKGRTELLEKLNQGLLIVKTNGEYDRIYQRWLVATDPWLKVQRYLWPALILVGALAMLATGLALILQWLVRKRTGELARANAEIRAEITERRKTEAALQTLNATLEQRVTERTAALGISEERYRSLFRNMSEGFALHEILTDTGNLPVDYRFLDVNPAFEQLTGLKPGDLLGKRILEVLPDTEMYWIERYGKVALTGEPAHFEEFHAGLGRWYDVFAYRPAPRQFAVVFTEITTRKRMENERDLTMKFLGLINASPDLPSLLAAATEFFCEQADCQAVGVRLQDGEDFPYCETRGFPKEFVRAENSLCCRDAAGKVQYDAIGNPVLACMCGNVLCGQFDPTKSFFTATGNFWTNSTTRLLAETTDADRQARTRNRCHGEGYESVALIGLCAGGKRLGLLQLNDKRSGHFTPEGIALWERLGGYLAVAVAKAQAEEALRESEARFRSTLDHSRDIIYRLNMQTNRYEYISPSAEAVVGFSCEHLKAMDAETGLAMVHPDDVPALQSAIRHLEATGMAEVEYRQRAKDGSYRWLSNRMSLIRDADGRPCYRSGNIRDITDRKRVEEALQRFNEELEARVAERTAQLQAAVEELRRSNEDLERFAYISSHDLQEPVRMVSIYADLLGHKYRDRLDAEANRYIGFAVEGAQRMSLLIKDLLAYSRVNTQGRTPVVTDTRAVVEQVLKTLRLRIQESAAHITCGTLPTVLADPAQLGQVFQNLVDNAIKYRKDIEPPTIHIGAELRDGRWRFEVRDNGIGIDPQYYEQIFVPFKRLHADRSRYPGSGIGLAIIKRIVEHHHGQVGVESVPGQGTTFYFTLPAV